jgi:hypothetical protein
LVRGESVHQLERVIHAGPIRVDRGRRRDEKVMIRGALTLLTNAVIAYNTWKLHQVLERSREAGQPVPSDEILAHAFRWSAIWTASCPHFLHGPPPVRHRKPLLLARLGKHPYLERFFVPKK